VHDAVLRWSTAWNDGGDRPCPGRATDSATETRTRGVVDAPAGRDDPRHLDDFSLRDRGDRPVDTRSRTGVCREPHDSSPGHHWCSPGHSRPRGARPVWPLPVNAAAIVTAAATMCTVTIVPYDDGF